MTTQMHTVADRLAELQEKIKQLEKDCNEQAARKMEIRADLGVVISERDEANALTQELKKELNYALSELHQARANARPEPSRLEIAAGLMVPLMKNDWTRKEMAVEAIKSADALIAASKESLSSSIPIIEKETLDQALHLLNWARICIYESELEWAPLDMEPLEVSPKTFRKRVNRQFFAALSEFKEKLRK